MDPYAVLGIPHGATEEEAKAAYRHLAKTCHPDLHPNDPQAEHKFKEISAAYDAIRNPQPDPFHHVHSTQFRFNDFPFGNSPFDELFANLHGYTRQQRNVDLHHEVRLTLEEAYQGREIEITLPTGRALKVHVPAGIEDGVSLRVAQAGDHSNKALRPGDLFILIRIQPHKTLLRAGRNLTAIVPVTAFDVLLGKEIEVIGIDGRALRVAIPTNFDTSRKMRLAGQGMPDMSGRGDLLIELFVTFPSLTDEQRRLVQQAAESSIVDHRSK
jgi:DnaJ-class molecular chaperone